MSDLQNYVSMLPNKITREQLHLQMSKENICSRISVNDAILSWCEHDAIHYLIGAWFDTISEIKVAKIEKYFGCGWYKHGSEYNTFAEFDLVVDIPKFLTEDMISNTAEDIRYIIDGDYFSSSASSLKTMKLEYSFVKKGVFDLPPQDWWDFDPEDSIEIQPHWKMENIAVEMGLFPSLGQARKNGWSGEIPPGYTEKRRIGKMKLNMFIHNPQDCFILDPECGKDT